MCSLLVCLMCWLQKTVSTLLVLAPCLNWTQYSRRNLGKRSYYNKSNTKRQIKLENVQTNEKKTNPLYTLVATARSTADSFVPFSGAIFSHRLPLMSTSGQLKTCSCFVPFHHPNDYSMASKRDKSFSGLVSSTIYTWYIVMPIIMEICRLKL